MDVHEKKSELFRVALADDNKEMRDTVIRLLGPEYVVVSAVADGGAFVNAVSELKPDVGILDISMPIMNGIEAATELQRLGTDTKIVILTVNEDRDFVRAAFDAGASAYVAKRQLTTDLRIALVEALAGRDFVSSGCDFAEAG